MEMTWKIKYRRENCAPHFCCFSDGL